MSSTACVLVLLEAGARAQVIHICHQPKVEASIYNYPVIW